jgi:pimeloyl-ACP methyl ester carboxylesterase
MEAVIERSVRVGELTFNLAECGEGPPVLFLHGFPDSWHLWRYQINAIAGAGYLAIAPDLRGFGNSDKPEAVEQYSIPLLLGDVIGVLDELGLDRVAVISHDWGAALQAWCLIELSTSSRSRLATQRRSASPGQGRVRRQKTWSATGCGHLRWPWR